MNMLWEGVNCLEYGVLVLDIRVVYEVFDLGKCILFVHIYSGSLSCTKTVTELLFVVTVGGCNGCSRFSGFAKPS